MVSTLSSHMHNNTTMRQLEFGSLPLISHYRSLYATTRGGSYHYTGDLLALERRAGPCIQPVPPILQINPPLRLDAWREQLASYPDKAFAAFLLRGIQNGFRIGIPMGSHLSIEPSPLASAQPQSSLAH